MSKPNILGIVDEAFDVKSDSHVGKSSGPSGAGGGSAADNPSKKAKKDLDEKRAAAKKVGPSKGAPVAPGGGKTVQGGSVGQVKKK